MKTSIDDSSFLSLEESDSPTGKGGAAGVVLNHGKEKPSNRGILTLTNALATSNGMKSAPKGMGSQLFS